MGSEMEIDGEHLFIKQLIKVKWPRKEVGIRFEKDGDKTSAIWP